MLAKVRHVLTAAGFDEAMTLSVVEEAWSEAFSPWTAAAPLRSSMPVLRRADRLRRSLVPSLLGARQTNESLANPGDRTVRNRPRLPAPRPAELPTKS